MIDPGEESKTVRYVETELDRTLPISVFRTTRISGKTSKQRDRYVTTHQLWFTLRLPSGVQPIDATLMKGLATSVKGDDIVVTFPIVTSVDTAASHSVMDLRLAHALGLPVHGVPGTIRVADTTRDRMGVTDRLHVIASFSDGRPDITFERAFEVLTLTDTHSVVPAGSDNSENFLVGQEDLHRLFGVEGVIPLTFIPTKTDSSTEDTSRKPAVSDHDISIRVNAVAVENPPEEGESVRVEVSTSEPLEEQYTRERNARMHRLHDALARNEAITGFCTLPETVVTISIDSDKANTLFVKQYLIADKLKELAAPVFQRWKEEGRIERAPSFCRFNSPITIAPKKDAEGNWTGIRVCIDTRRLNAALSINDRFEIPNITLALEDFAGCTLFGEFDLSEAYMQFQIHPDSRQFLAFTWEGEQWQFVGCPYGIMFLPGFFQRAMSRIFSDLTFVRPYIDNLPFAANDWDQHFDQALAIIERLNQINLRIKPASVKVGHSQMRCLGHLVSVHGIGIDPKKLEDLQCWQRPVTGKQLQTFLGFVQFIRVHVRHFADLTAPLEAIKNCTVIEWDDKLNEHYEATKRAIMNAPFLQFPDHTRPFHIATDASNTGVGGVLYQPSDGEENITPTNMVSICSKKLTETQQRYPAYKKELLGIVYCLRKFNCYVWGRNDLVIVTDHRPLTFILSSPQLSPALQQWLDVLLDYSFIVKHRPGILHVVPDALSRMYTDWYATGAWGTTPLTAIGDGKYSFSRIAPTDTHDVVLQSMPSVSVSAVTVHDEVDAVDDDPDMMDLLQARVSQIKLNHDASVATQHVDDVMKDFRRHMEAAQKQVETSRQATRQVSHSGGNTRVTVTLPRTQSHVTPTTKTTSTHPTLMSDEDEPTTRSESALCVEMERRGKCAPPVADRIPLVETAHAFGHFGRDAIFAQLYNDGYWWPQMRNDINTVLHECDACTRFVVTRRGYHPSRSITADLPWDHIQIDTSTHLPASTSGHHTLLVIIDVMTGLVILRALMNTKAETIARELWDVFCLLGLPKIMQSDNGTEFVNKILTALVKIAGIDHRLICAYNPRADGKVERSIGSVKQVIFKLLHGTDADWPLFVPFAQLTFNAKIAKLTGSSPFALFFNRPVNPLIDYTETTPVTVDVGLSEWRVQQEKILSLIYPAIRERIKDKKDTMMARLDAHRRLLLPRSIPTGTHVMLIDPDRKDKRAPPNIGPYVITRRAHNGAYVLRDMTGDILDRHVPADQLKVLSKRREAKKQADMTQTYVVERIIDHRGSDNEREFLVKWKGYDMSHNTWVAATDFHDTQCIRDYWTSQQHMHTQTQTQASTTQTETHTQEQGERDNDNRWSIWDDDTQENQEEDEEREE